MITGDLFDFDPRYIEEGCRELAALEAQARRLSRCSAITTSTPARTRSRAGSRRGPRSGCCATRGCASRSRATRSRSPASRTRAAAGTSATRRTTRSNGSPRRFPPTSPRLLLIHRPSWFAAGRAARLPARARRPHPRRPDRPARPRPAPQRLAAHLALDPRPVPRRAETGALLYVNRGLGVAGPPVRLNCSREISLLRLLAPRG